jgi:glucosamine--fructose-6-phosphate aminotransferase (isomerizing)
MENAHPHTDCKNILAVVHNGLIENFVELRRELERKGHIFRSKTDTEVIPHLIEEFYDENRNLREAVHEAIKKLRGSYAIGVISARESDKIVCARKESSLVVGIGKDSVYFSSDIPALLPLTNTAILLGEDEMAVLSIRNVQILDAKTGKVKEREVVSLSWTPEVVGKCGYPHFMLKEIHEQPLVLRNALRAQESHLESMASVIGAADSVYLVACGTSYHACLAASYMFSQLAHLSTQPVIASEFVENYGGSIGPRTVVLAVSQSGETADTLSAVRFAAKKGATILGITNVMGSTLTRLSKVYVGQNSGPEIGVAATKTFTAQLMVLAKIAITLAEMRRAISVEDSERLKEKLVKVPDTVQCVVENSEEKIKALAKRYCNSASLCYLGRGINYATAMEGRLKLLEIAYVPSLAYPAGESKHGFISLVRDGFPVIFVAPMNQTHEKIIGNIMEMKTRNADIIAILEEGDEAIKELADHYIEIPAGVPDILTPIPYVIPLQLFAYYMAVERGHNPDVPRNLAKSVTVE